MTAFIIPIFSFHDSPFLLENFNRLKESLNSDNIFVIELSFTDQFYIPESEKFIRIQATDENYMWQKERLINIALKEIPSEYTNIAWLDGDIVFKTDDISSDINEALKEHSIVQLFSKVNQLTETGDIFRTFNTCIGNKRGHTGFGWAIRRDDLENIGGLFDYHITGNGDCLLEYAFTDKIKGMSRQLLNKTSSLNHILMEYKHKVDKYIMSSVGYLKGEIDHLYHGVYSNRKYEFRERILSSNNFDPLTDVCIDEHTGLFVWNTNEQLRKDVCDYIGQGNYEIKIK